MARKKTTSASKTTKTKAAADNKEQLIKSDEVETSKSEEKLSTNETSTDCSTETQVDANAKVESSECSDKKESNEESKDECASDKSNKESSAKDEKSEASKEQPSQEKLDQVAKKDTSDKSKAADVSAASEEEVKSSSVEQEIGTEKSESKDTIETNEQEANAAALATRNREEDKPVDDIFKAHIIVVTSGKGGVGKTTTAASISTGLAQKGHKTCVIDFDVGLRNLDLIMGCERRVVYDFINVLHGEARLNQALIRDKNTEGGNLYVLAASQTKDKDSLTYAGVGRVLKELSDMGFEYIVCDSPAGIESGALIALYYADTAIVTTNPEISSVRDSDRIIGILDAKSRRAENGWKPVDHRLLLTRYVPSRVQKDEMLSLDDIHELLTIPLLGVIPESADVLKASNKGLPIIMFDKSEAGMAYKDAVDRLLGDDVPLRFMTENKGWLSKLFGK